MIDRRIPPCYDCGVWDDEREGCTMPAPDRQYACPLERDEENKEKDEELIRKSDVLDLLNQNYYRFRDTDYEIYSDLFDSVANMFPVKSITKSKEATQQ